MTRGINNQQFTNILTGLKKLHENGNVNIEKSMVEALSRVKNGSRNKDQARIARA